MDDEEYYECFRFPKEFIDEQIERVSSAAVLAMNSHIMQLVKEEIGNHPDINKLCKYYEDMSVISTRKITEKMVEMTLDASQYASKMKRKEHERPTGIG